MAIFHIKRGDTMDLSIAVLNNGAALDITGGAIKVTVKQDLDDADPGLAQVSATITNAAGGLATATIPASATNGLTDDTTVFYDVQYTSATGKIKTVDYGTIEVTRDVTRA